MAYRFERDFATVQEGVRKIAVDLMDDESTDGPAILRRVLCEPIEPDEDDLGPDLRDEDI